MAGTDVLKTRSATGHTQDLPSGPTVPAASSGSAEAATAATHSGGTVSTALGPSEQNDRAVPGQGKIPASAAIASPRTGTRPRETYPSPNGAVAPAATPAGSNCAAANQTPVNSSNAPGAALSHTQAPSNHTSPMAESKVSNGDGTAHHRPDAHHLGSSDSQHSKQSAGQSSSVDSDDLAMFAKRDLKQLVSQPSTSALSSFSSQASAMERRGKRFHRHHYNKHGDADSNVLGTSCDCACPSPPQSPPLHTNDQMRIRTPASAVPSRRNSIEIGTRMPFKERAHPSEDNLGPADAFLKVKMVHPARNYEPARAVMSTPTSPSRPVTMSNGAEGEEQEKTPQRAQSQASESPLQQQQGANVIKLPVDDLSKAPVERGARVPLKQLREPKHLLYIPAVLRPTESASYQKNRRPSAACMARTSSILPPRRSHWVPDGSRDSCMRCSRKFSLLDRRHHCRKCGGIFCARDSKYMIGIDHNLNFNLFGYPSRACRTCSDNFTHSVLEASRLTTDPTPLGASASQGITIGQRLESGAGELQVCGSFVPNMPADWSWSTF